MDKYDLSIIITCHNAEKRILPLLSSILLQHLNDCRIQFIFMCDTCNDRTQEIINRILDIYNMRNESIWIESVWYLNTNKSRNNALKYAQGNYTWLICDDDKIIGGSDSLMKLCNFLQNNNDNNIIRINFDTIGQSWYTTEELKNTYSFIWQYIFKTEWLKDNPLDESNNENSDSITLQNLFYKNDPENLNRNLLYYNNAIYYYDFCREGSSMYKKAKQFGYI